MHALVDKTEKIGGMRRMIANKMMQSLQSTAQLSFHAECDATALFDARRHLNRGPQRVGVEDLVIVAMCTALRENPRLNANVVDTEVRYSSSINVSVAIALPQGLVAPTLFDCQSLSPTEVAAMRGDLVARATASRLAASEMTGGTIALSNMGDTRVRHFTPILNIPQIAIVGLGRAEARPRVIAGEVAIRTILPISLTVDHRVVDGEPAGRFLSAICDAVERFDVAAG